MDLRGYTTAIRKGWWLVLLFAVVGGAIGAFQSYRATPIFAAHLKYYISTPPSQNSTALATNQFAQERATSYAELLSSDRLGDMIASAASLNMTGRQVAAEISATAELNTILVTATIKDPSAHRALKIAKAAATEFPKLVDQLDNIGGKTNVSLNVVSGPVVGSAPISPRKKLITGLGILVGLGAGLLAAVMRHLLDTSVRTTEGLEQASGVPTLSTIGFDKSARAEPLLVERASRSLRAEAFRRLRTNLQFIDAARELRVLVVTSSVEGEGKSTSAANLALVMAESGRKVLLIEADLRRPRVADYLGLERAVGLTNVLAGQAQLDDVLQSWGALDMTVLVSGTLPPNPSELLGGQAMQSLLDQLRSRFDLIILDTPPLLPVTDAAVLAAEADGVLVVFRYRTKLAQLKATLRGLAVVDAHVLGTVFNMKPISRRDRHSYGSYGAYADVPADGIDEVISVQDVPTDGTSIEEESSKESKADEAQHSPAEAEARSDSKPGDKFVRPAASPHGRPPRR
jgi:capsular exopolysaccharide synthesis family protein